MMMSISSPKTFNGIIGFPLTQSLSPIVHQALYEHFHLRADYQAFPGTNIDALTALIRTVPLTQISVTMPHKQSIMSFLDHIDPLAKKIGAVNTVLHAEGQLTGYNTDILGIAQSLSDVAIINQRVLLLGAGGAARPVAFFINEHQGELFCFNRTLRTAELLVKEFGGHALTSHELHSTSFDVVINATPLGTEDARLPLPMEILQPHHVIFDLNYHQKETFLLKYGRQIGARTLNGLHMFITQASEQFQLWTQHQYDPVEVRTVISHTLTPLL